MRTIAIVPARNEAECIGGVVAGIKAFDASFEVLVVDDGSTDRTAALARRSGARVVSLPFNLGIGGAVQTGFKLAYDEGFDVAVRLDGDGQHIAAELPKLHLRRSGRAPRTSSSARASRARREYRPPFARRIGHQALRRGRLAARRDSESPTRRPGSRPATGKAIRLFAADYPHDYPEVEATVMVFKHRLRLAEVPVKMREREAGRSSIGGFWSVYYAIKVLLAVFMAVSRRKCDATGGGRVTPWIVSVAAVAVSLLLLGVVVHLIRSRRLRERYALLWLLTGLVLLALSAWRDGLNTIAGWVGVTGYPPAVLFATATLFILAVLLHYSTVISRLSDQNSLLAQRLALLEEQLRRQDGGEASLAPTKQSEPPP